MTQRDAVFAAIKKIGDRTSLKELSAVASKIYGSSIGDSACCSYRGHWRKQNGSDIDCRTYDGQPERNMFKGQVESRGGQALHEFVRSTNISLDQLLQLASAFNGLEQFCQTAKDLQTFYRMSHALGRAA